MMTTKKADGCDGASRYRYQRVLRWQTSVSRPAWKYTIVIMPHENNDVYGWYDGSVDQWNPSSWCLTPVHVIPQTATTSLSRLTPRGQNNTRYLITHWPTETCQHIFCARAIEMWRALVGRLSRRAVNHPIHGPPASTWHGDLGMVKTLAIHTTQIDARQI